MNFFSESYFCKGYGYILISIWFGSLITSHQVPIRKKCVYLEAACQIFGPIMIALFKLEGYQIISQNIKKQLTRMTSFLTLLCRKVKTRHIQMKAQSLANPIKQKGLITKLSITSYLFGLYVKQSLGNVLKIHILEQNLNTVNLDWSCSNGNGLQPLVCNSPDCWNYFVQPLSLKLVAWNNKGSLLAEPIVNVLAKHGLQRKISSNKNTMAKTMHQKLYKIEASELAWKCDTMHIKCFCHKMALVVNAGLKKLVLEAPPPPKLHKSFLGSVPYSNNLKPIVEEYEYVVDEEGSDCEVDTDDKKDNSGDDSNICTSQKSIKKKTSATNRNKSNKFHKLTQNVFLDFVIKMITGSAAWRQEFKLCSNAVEGKRLEPLISGYGIHWNINYEGHRCAYNAREFLKFQDQITRQSHKQNCNLLGHFKGIQFTQSDWIQIMHLKNEFKDIGKV
ncbi:hypothetical protein VP01_1664g7 [Puccinia sorghi]|uniref:Uncharacterized protein n=1 Tax=Puccinia sorghi TaxID=27349 RepID=A0A0L6VG95_9BASI|nr:hypothetical protein VP01_1664g7 [Puccinia sorghi]